MVLLEEGAGGRPIVGEPAQRSNHKGSLGWCGPGKDLEAGTQGADVDAGQDRAGAAALHCVCASVGSCCRPETSPACLRGLKPADVTVLASSLVPQG